MPIFMGIHPKPIGHSHSAFLDSRILGNDGVWFFPENALIDEGISVGNAAQAL